MRKLLKRSLESHHLLRILAHRAQAPIAILCYHDIREDNDIESWMRVPVSRFFQQLTSLGRIANFIGPDKLEKPSRLDRSKLNVLVTFDDGYINNLRLALPVLEELEVPAIFFISTEHVISGRIFWSDKVITPIQLLGLESLDLSEHGFRRYDFRKESANRWEDVQAMLCDLKAVGNQDHPRVASVIEDLDCRFGKQIGTHQDRYRPLDSTELYKLSESRVAYIGSHGHWHEILTILSDTRLTESLNSSRRFLEGVTGQPVEHLAYPNGDADARVVEAAKIYGYRYGYLTRGDLCIPNHDKLRLPRILVGGYDSARAGIYQVNRNLVAAMWSNMK